jgi:hypothetical protein
MPDQAPVLLFGRAIGLARSLLQCSTSGFNLRIGTVRLRQVADLNMVHLTVWLDVLRRAVSAAVCSLSA